MKPGVATKEKLQAVRRGQIAATLKREQREAEAAKQEILVGRIKARMPAKSARLDEIPPYCHLLPGRSPEEAARVAVADLKTPHLIDALAIFWKLRRAALEPSKAPIPSNHPQNHQKTPQRPTAQASTPFADHSRGLGGANQSIGSMNHV